MLVHCTQAQHWLSHHPGYLPSTITSSILMWQCIPSQLLLSHCVSSPIWPMLYSTVENRTSPKNIYLSHIPRPLHTYHQPLSGYSSSRLQDRIPYWSWKARHLAESEVCVYLHHILFQRGRELKCSSLVKSLLSIGKVLRNTWQIQITVITPRIFLTRLFNTQKSCK